VKSQPSKTEQKILPKINLKIPKSFQKIIQKIIFFGETRYNSNKQTNRVLFVKSHHGKWNIARLETLPPIPEDLG
jgi:hypothetical protein